MDPRKTTVNKAARTVELWFEGGRHEVHLPSAGQARVRTTLHFSFRLPELSPEQREMLVNRAAKLLRLR